MEIKQSVNYKQLSKALWTDNNKNGSFYAVTVDAFNTSKKGDSIMHKTNEIKKY